MSPLSKLELVNQTFSTNLRCRPTSSARKSRAGFGNRVGTTHFHPLSKLWHSLKAETGVSTVAAEARLVHSRNVDYLAAQRSQTSSMLVLYHGVAAAVSRQLLKSLSVSCGRKKFQQITPRNRHRLCVGGQRLKPPKNRPLSLGGQRTYRRCVGVMGVQARGD